MWKQASGSQTKGIFPTKVNLKMINLTVFGLLFFPDGKPRWQGYKKEGINHGRYTLWYDNGRKRMEGTYENGKKQGLSTSWHPNGAKWQHQLHVAGQPTGT